MNIQFGVGSSFSSYCVYNNSFSDFSSSTFIRDGMTAQISVWGATEKDKGPDSNKLKIANVGYSRISA